MGDLRTPYDFELALNAWLAQGTAYTAQRLGELPPGRVLELLQAGHLAGPEDQGGLNGRCAALNDRLRRCVERLCA